MEQDDKRFLLRERGAKDVWQGVPGGGRGLPPTVRKSLAGHPGQDAAHSAHAVDGWVKSSPIKKMQPFTVEDELMLR